MELVKTLTFSHWAQKIWNHFWHQYQLKYISVCLTNLKNLDNFLAQGPTRSIYMKNKIHFRVFFLQCLIRRFFLKCQICHSDAVIVCFYCDFPNRNLFVVFFLTNVLLKHDILGWMLPEFEMFGRIGAYMGAPMETIWLRTTLATRFVPWNMIKMQLDSCFGIFPKFEKWHRITTLRQISNTL